VSALTGAELRRVAVADDYAAFCDGLRDLAGVDLTQYKRPQMERRLRSFFERQGIARLTDALAVLRRDRRALDALLDRMTINVSQLWRNPEQWERLEADVLPELAERGELRAWSAGSSYGAEAYTLAAICAELPARVSARIVGTDIDRRMVERARLGEFSPEDARTAPAASLERWFDPTERGWRAKPQLRAMTRFEQGDLLRMRVPNGAFDLILCRNTVIYFSEPVRDELHARLADALRPGGVLMIGSTERVSNADGLGLKTIRPFTFRKR
jgi:chemotaxis protein methyltransferase CheR